MTRISSKAAVTEFVTANFELSVTGQNSAFLYHETTGRDLLAGTVEFPFHAWLMGGIARRHGYIETDGIKTLDQAYREINWFAALRQSSCGKPLKSALTELWSPYGGRLQSNLPD
ncbi:MAG: hypothetical protein KIY12_08985, partial [Thermoplasmata archaeon]|nr:hypothetical protein [Candidatus Sysuiplasma superficiale]